MLTVNAVVKDYDVVMTSLDHLKKSPIPEEILAGKIGIY